MEPMNRGNLGDGQIGTGRVRNVKESRGPESVKPSKLHIKMWAGRPYHHP